jgi:hypothetical protein
VNDNRVTPLIKASLLKSSLQYSVKRHLHRLQLSVYGISAYDVYKSLIDSLKLSQWCSYKGHFIPQGEKYNPAVDLFACPSGGTFSLTMYSNGHCFIIQLFDPDIDIQINVLTLLGHVCAGIHSVHVSLSQAEFALDFSPKKQDNLFELFHIIEGCVVMRHSRIGAYNSYEGLTGYHGRKGYVRPKKERTIRPDGKSKVRLVCGAKGLTVYTHPKENSDRVRVELRCNRIFLRNRGLGVHNLPFTHDTVDVLDYIEFRNGLDSKQMMHLVDVICEKQCPGFSKWPRPRQMTRRWIIDGIILRKLTNADYNYDLNEVPTALQVSVLKEIKKTYNFTNQIGEFLPKNKHLMKNIKRCLSGARKR